MKKMPKKIEDGICLPIIASILNNVPNLSYHILFPQFLVQGYMNGPTKCNLFSNSNVFGLSLTENSLTLWLSKSPWPLHSNVF